MIESDNKLASTKRQGYKQKGKGLKKPENKRGYFDYKDYNDPFFSYGTTPIYRDNNNNEHETK